MRCVSLTALGIRINKAPERNAVKKKSKKGFTDGLWQWETSYISLLFLQCSSTTFYTYIRCCIYSVVLLYEYIRRNPES